MAMLKKIILILPAILLLYRISNAQQYILSSSRWSDLNSKSTRNTPSTITIDSSMITISMGESNLYLEVKKQQRNENIFLYDVIDYNDLPCTAVFQPEEMIFDFQSKEFRMRYFIDKIERPKQEAAETAISDTATQENDTAEVKEDTKVYESADVMPEFPGGKEAMMNWLVENVKYPPAAKKAGIKGLVNVTVVVEKDGSLSAVSVKRDIGGGCGEEAVRAVKEMPTWIPGQIKNEDKRVRVTISVFFPPK